LRAIALSTTCISHFLLASFCARRVVGSLLQLLDLDRDCLRLIHCRAKGRAYRLDGRQWRRLRHDLVALLSIAEAVDENCDQEKAASGATGDNGAIRLATFC
jgi:hypothetical protein